MALQYTGNVPANVCKDAKYSVVHGPHGMEIRLIYSLPTGEKALVTTSAHPELVEMVNAVKEDYQGGLGGAFYINEYAHVVVPAEGGYYFAGEYRRYLEFKFEGSVIGPEPPEGLRPGDEWRGPKVGTAYTLTADAQDVKFKISTRPNVFREKRLSEEAGSATAARLARRLGKHKTGGGRIYINEARAFFAPVNEAGEWTRLYLGSLGDDEWFGPPRIE